MDLKEEFARVLTDRMVARTLTSCSRWAAHRRVMGEPFPGPYTWRFHPWVKELHDSWAPFNWCMKGAQLGITEVAINRALYTLDVLKRNVLYVLPTALNASRFSKSRFVPALNSSPYIQGMFTDINSINLKQTATSNLFISGSRGDSNLKNIPASELILDEVDEMEQKQIWLALERLSGQLHKHVYGISTPTVPEHGIHKLFRDSTQEHFFFPCPACGRWTELLWPDCVEIAGEHPTDVRCKESFLKCKECKARLEHAAKPEFLSKGKWQSTAASNPDVRGFYINQLYSFTVTPGELAAAYHRGRGDELASKEFFNSKLGLPFVGSGAKVTEEMIAKTIHDHSMDDPRPAQSGRLITMGVDQGKTCFVVVCEWLFSGPPGKDIDAAAVCRVLWCGKFLEEEWHCLDELMREWQVLYAVVDADPQVNEARRFARRYPGYAGLCRYRRSQTAKEVAVSEEDSGAPMITVDRTNWLSATLGRFRGTLVGAPRIQLPRDAPAEFMQHMKSLVRTYQRDEHGNPVAVYVETGADHYAHALTYAAIALQFAPLVTTRLGKVL